MSAKGTLAWPYDKVRNRTQTTCLGAQGRSWPWRVPFQDLSFFVDRICWRGEDSQGRGQVQGYPSWPWGKLGAPPARALARAPARPLAHPRIKACNWLEIWNPFENIYFSLSRFWVFYFGPTSEVHIFEACNQQKIWNPFENLYLSLTRFWVFYFASTSEIHIIDSCNQPEIWNLLKTYTFHQADLELFISGPRLNFTFPRPVINKKSETRLTTYIFH